MNPSAPCFLLVDDHALFRTGLGMMLAEHWPEAVMRHAGDWAQALSSARALRPAPETPDTALMMGCHPSAIRPACCSGLRAQSDAVG